MENLKKNTNFSKNLLTKLYGGGVQYKEKFFMRGVYEKNPMYNPLVV